MSVSTGSCFVRMRYYALRQRTAPRTCMHTYAQSIKSLDRFVPFTIASKIFPKEAKLERDVDPLCAVYVEKSITSYI